jgi:hypothetical protein
MKKQISLLFIGIILLSSCARFSTPSGAPLQVSSSTSYTGRVNTGSGRTSGYTTTYYIKKSGEDKLVLNGRNLIKMVSDNEKALAQARVYKATKTVALTSFLTMFAGLTYGILGKESNNTKIAKQIGVLSIPVLIISAPLSSSFAKKSIKTYNAGF